MAKRSWIEGYYTLPVAVLLRAEALGTTTSVLIGGRSGEMRLPRADPKALDHLALSQGLAPPVGYHPRFVETEKVWARWGRVFATEATGVPLAAAVWRVMLRFPVADRSREAGNLLGGDVVKAGGDWLRSVFLWLQILTKQDLDADDPRREVSGGASGFFLWGSEAAGKAFIALGPQTGTITSELRDSWVQRAQWRRAVRAASNGESPPLPWEIWVSAARASRRAQWRRSVVEAGTAVEIAVEMALRTHLLQQNPRPTVDAMVSEVRMLGRRIAFGRKLGIKFPSDVEAALLAPRNEAVHTGVSPAATVARRALKAAHDVLQALVPLV